MKKQTKIISVPIMLFLIIALGINVPRSYAQSSPTLNDAQVAYVAVVGNKIDIQYAKIAKEKSKNPAVTAFARTMIDNHTTLINDAAALAKKLGVTPKPSTLSKTLESGAAKTRKILRGKSGADFDKAYIDNEVAYHEAVIGVVKNTLIPDATNAQLKSLLKKALIIFEGHLGYAKVLKEKLGY